MPSLKDLKNRIGSVKNTQKITKAMKMVAASKLRRAQERAEQARPYTEKMREMMSSLTTGSENTSDSPTLLHGTGHDKRHLLVVCTSSRGLCGGFNVSISKAALVKANELLNAGKDVKIICVGRKGYDYLKRFHRERIVETIEGAQKKQIDYGVADDIAGKITELFAQGEFDVCTLFYNKFLSAISQKVTAQQLIPLEIGEENEAEASDISFEYEPEESEILDYLLPKNLATQIFAGLLENQASEQGARMTAMDNATRNAGEMIDRLTLQYNRSRQAAITKELIEIISGAEAL